MFRSKKKVKIDSNTVPQWLIVGLGNPGKQYERTRHNAGFMAIDKLADEHGIDVDTKLFDALVGFGDIGGTDCLLMKPQTYMNLSGNAVTAAMKRYRMSPDRILVITDDICFNVGSLRIRKNGSSGGQKGVNHIITLLGTQEFARIKIGAGKRPEGMDTPDWVLSKFRPDEMEDLRSAIDSAAKAVDAIINGSIDNAMGKFNKTV